MAERGDDKVKIKEVRCHKCGSREVHYVHYPAMRQFVCRCSKCDEFFVVS